MTQARKPGLAESVSAALEREHREIDQAIKGLVDGTVDNDDRQQLMDALHALRRHIYAEEEFLFPALRDAGLVGAVLVMLREHAQMWLLLDRVDEVIAADDAGNMLREACASLLELLQRHNPKEETILYPQIDGLLGSESASVLRQLLVGGDLPIDWRCQHLR